MNVIQCIQILLEERKGELGIGLSNNARYMDQCKHCKVHGLLQTMQGTWFSANNARYRYFIQCQQCKVHGSMSTIFIRDSVQLDRGIYDKNFKFYLGIFGCSLPEPHNFSCRIPRSQWDRGIETAEILWHRGNPYKNEYWFSIPLKGNYRKNQYICKHCIHIDTRKRQY
jgi:hypothetical protein